MAHDRQTEFLHQMYGHVHTVTNPDILANMDPDVRASVYTPALFALGELTTSAAYTISRAHGAPLDDHSLQQVAASFRNGLKMGYRFAHEELTNG